MKNIDIINYSIDCEAQKCYPTTCFIFRKSSQDEDVITLAKNLIKAWKKFLPDNSGSNSSSNDKDKKVHKIMSLYFRSF